MDWLPRLLRPRRRADDGADHDEQLMREVQLRGDHEAFAQLLRRWEPPIRRLCIRMSGDEHRGEDLAQEAFIRAFAARRQFDPTRKFSTWLWRIALNLCFEESRRAARREEVSLGVEARLVGASSNDDAPDAQAIGRERAELVRSALALLPEAQRVVVVLREYEGLKCREIADILDVPEGTVKWRMADALEKLSRRLKSLAPTSTKAEAETVQVTRE